jgi:hypothetical protein
VSLALLKTLTKTAEKLLEGWSHTERIPAVAEGDFVDWNSTLVDPGPSRGTFVKNQTNFSTEEGEGHLLFLGEFFAMYLFAWSDALWLRNIDGRPTLPLAENFPHLMETYWPWQIFEQTKQDKARRHFDEHRARALHYARALPQVRRVLANVPTYMIFDDHEVTDDWFIDGPWDADVREDLASRQVVRNGLLAYAVFQDWGNHPENYASTPARTVLDSITYSEGVDPVILAMPNACDWLLDIREISQARPDAQHRMIWDFDVEGPQHVIIALDTRTWRFYPSRTRKGHAGLISPESMDRQIDARRVRFPNKLPIIISAAPVVGHPITEVAQELCVETDLPLFQGPRDTRVTRFDFEAWIGSRTTFEDFLGRIAKFGRAVLVSGDVHYAFSNQLAYFPDGLAPARIVQLCSSAFKNESDGTHAIGSAGYAGITKIGWLGFNEDLSAPMRQQLLEALQSGMAKDSVGAFISRLYHELIVAQRLYKPAVIPSGPWVTPQATAIVSALADNPGGQQSRTDWRYSVEYLEDVRPETQRKDDAGIQATYLVTTEHGARTVAFDSSRTVVGDNNVGRITFVTDAGGSPTLLVHRLYWDARTPDGTRMLGPVMFTETRAPLTAPSPAERPTVTQ